MSTRKENNTFQTLHCSKCRDWLKLEFKNFDRMVDYIHIIVPQMPLLICPSCGEEYLPNWTKGFVGYIIEESKKRGTKIFKGERRKDASTRQYNFCANARFNYDASDCEFIPGLQSPFADDGFFTPVFFNRKVLHKFLSFDEYRVSLGSNTYGTIYKKDEWYISFGINRSGKVFFWLGDLDELPLNEQQYLQSENVDSDHDVGSDFYGAQREVLWGEHSDESKLLLARSNLEKLCENKYGFKLFDYEKDDYEIHEELARPVNWNEKGVIHVINYLTKLCIEGICTNALRKELKRKGEASGIDKLQGLKLLEKWLIINQKNPNAHDIMKPFFVLYDFRIVLDHKLSKKDAEKTMDFCYERLGIKEKNFEKLYEKIIDSITQSYLTITMTLS